MGQNPYAPQPYDPSGASPYAPSAPQAGAPYAPSAQDPYAGQAYAGQAYAGQAYAAQPYAGQAVMYADPQYAVPKSKADAAVLAVFLGWAGAPNFYQRQTGRAIGHLVMAVLAIALFVTALVMVANDPYIPNGSDKEFTVGLLTLGSLFVLGVNALWAFIEFIIVLVSDDGRLT